MDVGDVVILTHAHLPYSLADDEFIACLYTSKRKGINISITLHALGASSHHRVYFPPASLPYLK